MHYLGYLKSENRNVIAFCIIDTVAMKYIFLINFCYLVHCIIRKTTGFLFTCKVVFLCFLLILCKYSSVFGVVNYDNDAIGENDVHNLCVAEHIENYDLIT